MSDEVRIKVSDDACAMRVNVTNQTAGVGLRVNSVSKNSAVCDAAFRLVNPREIRLDGSTHGKTLFDGTRDVVIHTEVNAITNWELEEILK